MTKSYTYYLHVDRRGEARLKKGRTPSNYGDRVVKLILEVPEGPPAPEILVQLPTYQPIGVVQQPAEYGVQWALRMGYIVTRAVTDSGKVEFELTDEGARYALSFYKKTTTDTIYGGGSKLNTVCKKPTWMRRCSMIG